MRTSGRELRKTDLLGVGEGAVPGFEVGDDVLDEEGADGDDAGERVQAAPEEGVALAGAEGLDPFGGGAEIGGGEGCGGGHECSCLRSRVDVRRELIIPLGGNERQGLGGGLCD